MAGLEDLGDDILYSILDYLNNERVSVLRCLRSTSRRLSHFAESALYRTLVLEEDNGAQEQASFRCIERLLDPTDALRYHVRFLRVRTFYGDDASSCMNTRLLQNCLGCIHKLESFSWDTEVPLPSDLLKTLHCRQPSAQLCVSVQRLNREIVTSSQLHRLSVTIPCSDITSPNSSAPFEHVRHVLLHNTNMRALSIDAHMDCNLRNMAIEEYMKTHKAAVTSYGPISIWSLRKELIDEFWKNHTPGPARNKVQIPLKATDQLPKLEEIAFKARTYAFDKDHCYCLQQCVDWSRMKRLTLDCSDYGSFFDIFAYEMLQLEHLDVSVQAYGESHSTRRPSHTDAFSRFMSSLHVLRSLVIRYNDNDLCDDFWPNLVGTHGERLVHLSLRRSHTNWAEFICQDRLWAVLGSFTALKSLDLDMPISPFSRFVRCIYCESNCGIRTMPYIPSLERLYISTRVSSNDERAMDVQYTSEACIALKNVWSIYTVRFGICNLDSVDFEFWRWKAPSPHPNVDRLAESPGVSCRKLTFESTRRNHQLVIKARDERKVTTTYYNEIREVLADRRTNVSYVATHQHQRERHRG